MGRYVVGIGAANVDIYCKSSINIREHFDHPAKISYSPGGVTRNILENLVRLGINAKILTAVGDDIYGNYLKDKIEEVGIDSSNILMVDNENTGVFVQVQDSNNDMHLAMCDMSILNNIDVSYIEKNKKIIEGATCLIIDPSLNESVLDYIFDNFSVPVFVDPISDLYAKKIKKYLNKIYCIKPNKNELGVLTDIVINNDNDLYRAYEKLLETNVKKAFVSLGKDGCLYKDNSVIKTKKFKQNKVMVNASGAGDSFFAAIVYAYVSSLSVDDTINSALAAGLITVMCKEAINKDLSKELIDKIIKENL